MKVEVFERFSLLINDPTKLSQYCILLIKTLRSFKITKSSLKDELESNEFFKYISAFSMN